jgi:very-short-patch-repair endonuclease
MTLTEVLLWRQLRLRPGGFKFRRQFPFGRMTADFACLECRLIIEVDGMAHDGEEAQRRDLNRDRIWQDSGFAVLRINASNVLNNIEGVVKLIVTHCSDLGPLHHSAALSGPPPRFGEE